MRAAIAASTSCGRGVPLEPKPPPTCWAIDAHVLGVEAEHLGERRGGAP